jgi:hypothetical protein
VVNVLTDMPVRDAQSGDDRRARAQSIESQRRLGATNESKVDSLFRDEGVRGLTVGDRDHRHLHVIGVHGLDQARRSEDLVVRVRRHDDEAAWSNLGEGR